MVEDRVERCEASSRVYESYGVGGTREKKIKKQKTRKGVAELLTLVNWQRWFAWRLSRGLDSWARVGQFCQVGMLDFAL